MVKSLEWMRREVQEQYEYYSSGHDTQAMAYEYVLDLIDQVEQSTPSNLTGLEWLKEEVQELLLQDKLDGINYFDYKRLKEDIWKKIDQVKQPALPEIPEFVAKEFERMDNQ